MPKAGCFGDCASPSMLLQLDDKSAWCRGPVSSSAASAKTPQKLATSSQHPLHLLGAHPGLQLQQGAKNQAVLEVKRRETRTDPKRQVPSRRTMARSQVAPLLARTASEQSRFTKASSEGAQERTRTATDRSEEAQAIEGPNPKCLGGHRSKPGLTLAVSSTEPPKDAKSRLLWRLRKSINVVAA